MGGWEGIGTLIGGLWERFFSKEVTDKKARMEITKLKRALGDALESTDSPQNRQRVDVILKRLRELVDEATAK